MDVLEVGELYSRGVLSHQYGYDIITIDDELFRLEKRNAPTYYAILHHPTWMLKISIEVKS